MSLNVPGPAYRILTSRLAIRCWDPADVYIYENALSENTEHLKTYLPWAQNYPEEIQKGIERLRIWRGKFDLGQDFVYGVFNREESRVLGGTGLHTRHGPNVREIGYWVHKDFTGQGLATELSAALTRVAFEVDGVERVEIHCAVENLASASIPRKLGFTHEAVLRQRTLLLDGRRHDQMVWTILREEFAASPCASAKIEVFDASGREIL